MASKTATTKFEVEKFDGKSNFLLWKMRVMVLLAKEGVYKALLGKEKRPEKMEEDEWVDMDVRARATIVLCLADEVLYNVMGEVTAAAMWCKLEGLYMTKSFSNKLYMKKQLYGLRMDKGTPIFNISTLSIGSRAIFWLWRLS